MPSITCDRHAKVSMTMEVYAHVLPDLQADAARRIGSLLTRERNAVRSLAKFRRARIRLDGDRPCASRRFSAARTVRTRFARALVDLRTQFRHRPPKKVILSSPIVAKLSRCSRKKTAGTLRCGTVWLRLRLTDDVDCFLLAYGGCRNLNPPSFLLCPRLIRSVQLRRDDMTSHDTASRKPSERIGTDSHVH